jgi:hypothetical protein
MPGPDEMEKYEIMLDELAESYPELEDSALTLKGELAEMDMPEEDPEMDEMPMEEDEEVPAMPMDFDDEEEDFEDEEEDEEDEMAGFEKY